MQLSQLNDAGLKAAFCFGFLSGRFQEWIPFYETGGYWFEPSQVYSRTTD